MVSSSTTLYPIGGGGSGTGHTYDKEGWHEFTKTISFEDTSDATYYQVSLSTGSSSPVWVDDLNITVSEGIEVATAELDVLSFIDYYAFGMEMEGRKHNTPEYRYGFNGAEKEDEWTNNSGDVYDLGLRCYDARLGRMFSRDPREEEYSWQSTYAYYANSPISTIDYLGGGGPTTVSTPKSKKIDKLTPSEEKYMKKLVSDELKKPRKAFKNKLNSSRTAVFSYVFNKFLSVYVKNKQKAFVEANKEALSEIELIKTVIIPKGNAIYEQLKKDYLEVITTDYSSLEDGYIQEVIQRVNAGKGSEQDRAIYDWVFSVSSSDYNLPKNVNLRKTSTIGQEAHRQIQKQLVKFYGKLGLEIDIEVWLDLELADGTQVRVRKDAMIDGQPVIIKPNTVSGKASAAARAKLLNEAGYDGINNPAPIFIFYDPNDPAYLPGSPTYIGPGGTVADLKSLDSAPTTLPLNNGNSTTSSSTKK